MKHGIHAAQQIINIFDRDSFIICVCRIIMAEVKKFGGSAKCYACEKSLYPADPQTK
jgi:hypothetical protein